MYTIVVKEEKIREYQALLEKILKYNTDSSKSKLSHRRAKEDSDEGKDKLYDIFWSSQFKFWSGFDHNKPKKRNRYWNIFGLLNPSDNKNLSITVEICIPKKDEEKRIAGLFIIDRNTNDIAIVHRGRLSGKSMNYFWTNYNRKTIDLIDGTKVALIGVIPKDELQYLDFQKNVRDFLIEINRIKNIENEIDISHTANVITDNKQKDEAKVLPSKAILIKGKKPEQLLVNINEAFSKILPVTVKFIGNTLKEKSNNWKGYATKDLSDIAITNLHLEGSIDDFIMNLDILTSFHILKNNWNILFMSKFPKNSRKDMLDYIHRLITIRNNIKAHDTMNVTEQYNKDRFDHDLGTMIFFIDHIDKNISDELRKMKNNP